MTTTYLTHYERIILENINLDDYDVVLSEAFSNVNAVYNIFKKEYCYPANLQRYKTKQRCFAEWLKGLPTVLSVPFYNYDILQDALLGGFNLTTELDEHNFLDMYWTNLAKAFFTLKENL
jgi:hypothetical protein